MSRIEYITRTLDAIPNINSGGCGIAALAIAQYIRQAEPDTDIFYLFEYSEHDVFKANYDRIVNGNQHADIYVPSHIYVVYKQYVYDTEGCHGHVDEWLNAGWTDCHLASDYFLTHIITPENTVWGWNWMFRRDKAVPYIERVIGEPLAAEW